MEQYHVIAVLRLRASEVPVLFFENKFINFLDELVSSVVSTFPVENPNPAACFAPQRTFSPRLAGSRAHSPQWGAFGVFLAAGEDLLESEIQPVKGLRG